MQVSQRAEYAVRAVLDLAIHATPERSERAADVARRTGVPEKFLQAILLDLRKGGFVESKRGPSGGHWLARSPERVSVGEIVRAIDGPDQAHIVRDAGASPADQCLRAMWARVAGQVRESLDAVSFEDLLRDAKAQRADDYCI